jgi:hypothetical protein
MPEKEVFYRCMANVRSKGNDKDYNVGDVLNEQEYKLVPKIYKHKFIRQDQMRFEGDVETLQKLLQDAYLKIDVLEGHIRELRGGGQAVTTETGGQPKPKKK